MEANKTRRITDAKYKTAFYTSLNNKKTLTPDEVMQKLQEDAYAEKKYEIDRKFYSTTYQLDFGKERYAPI
jgi:hypothetical protein